MDAWVDDLGQPVFNVQLLGTDQPLIIDAMDRDYIENGTWSVWKNGYATWMGVYLHRLITRAPIGVRVDHKNLNKLDCRRSNLRLVTGLQNSYNVPKKFRNGAATSQFKGVYYNRLARIWCAGIVVNGSRLWLGSHATERDAAMAYNNAAAFHFGEFAYLNTL